MTYQPKNAGKMAGFETVTRCISLSSRQDSDLAAIGLKSHEIRV